MLKLGGTKRLALTVEDPDGAVSDVVLVYRRPTASEWIAYNAQAGALYGRVPRGEGEAPPIIDSDVLAGLLEATRALGDAVLVEVNGVEAEGDTSAADVVRRDGPELILHLGRHVAGNGGLKLSPGKSGAPSV